MDGWIARVTFTWNHLTPLLTFIPQSHEIRIAAGLPPNKNSIEGNGTALLGLHDGEKNIEKGNFGFAISFRASNFDRRTREPETE